MDLEYIGHVLARVRPLIRDGKLRRSRLERVLNAGAVPAYSVRADVERMLAKVKIAIIEDADNTSEAVRDGQEGACRPSTPSDSVDGTADKGEADPADPPAYPLSQEALQASRTDRRIAAVAAARRLLAIDATVQERYLQKRLLDAELEVGLALLMRGGPKADAGDVVFAQLTGEARSAANALFLHNQRLVHKISQKYPATGMDYDDIVQFGFLGLIRAIEKFDPTAGFKFSTYATWWVRQAITRGIADHARLIRLPVHMVERLNKVWSARDRLTVDGEPPNVHTLALATGFNDAQVREVLRLGRFEPLSLDSPVGPDGETTLGDLLDVEDERLDPVHEVEFMLLQEDLYQVLDTLTEREAGVISMRYGLVEGEGKTLDEIGKVYGVTRERIRQIENKTMAKLREPSCVDALEGYLYGGGRQLEEKSTDDSEDGDEAPAFDSVGVT